MAGNNTDEISPEKWLKTNTFHHRSFADISRLVDLKEEKGLKISVALATLSRMSFAILQAFFARAEELWQIKIPEETNSILRTIRRRRDGLIIDETEIAEIERPPMIEVEAYCKKRGLEPHKKKGEE